MDALMQQKTKGAIPGICGRLVMYYKIIIHVCINNYVHVCTVVHVHVCTCIICTCNYNVEH